MRTCVVGGVGMGLALGGWKVSWRAMSASISARILSMFVGRSVVCNLKGPALAYLASWRLRLASLAACTTA